MQHEAHRVEIDLVGLGGEVVALLGELGAVGDHLLAGRAELVDGARELLEHGLGRAVELVEVEHQHRDAPVGGGGADRVGEIPEQRLGVPVTARLLDGALDRIAASCSTSSPSGAITSAAFAGMCGAPRRSAPITQPKMTQQQDQVQELAQAVQAAPQSQEERIVRSRAG